MKDRSNLRACLDPVQLPFFPDGVLVRCGKCVNCLKHKGNELAVRVYREGISYGYAHWITLTYENKNIPLYSRRCLVDVDSGEILQDSGLSRLNGDSSWFFEVAPFQWRINKNARPTKRFFPLIQEYPAESLSRVYGRSLIYRDETYFSVDMSDFQMYMKRFRHLLPDKYKESFRYIAVPEYGGVGFRPHIHLVVCGIPIDVFQPFMELWSSECGYQNDVDTIDFSKSTASESIGKVASYVSKYACKGKYDCPYIGDYCLKPRRCSSRDFGCGSPAQWDRLESHLLAYDVYGFYDPFDENDPILPMVSPRLLFSRRYCAIGDYPYPVPRLLLDKVFRRRRVVPRGFSRYVVSYLDFQNVPCYESKKKFSYFFEFLDGSVKNAEVEVLRKFYSPCFSLRSTPKYECVHVQKASRFYSVSCSLQKEITILVLDDLRKDAERKFQQSYNEIEVLGYSASLDRQECSEQLYRYAVIRSFQADLERSVF